MQKNTYPFCKKDISDYSVIWTKVESFMEPWILCKCAKRQNAAVLKILSIPHLFSGKRDKKSQKKWRDSYFIVEVIGYSKINDINSDKNHA